MGVPHEGVFTTADAAKKTGIITFQEYNVHIVTGIEFFPNITGFDCGWNNVTSLDITNNTALTYLRCDSNQLTNLDVTKNTALEFLYCSSNQLTNLDVSKNTALIVIECNDNQLTSISSFVANPRRELYEIIGIRNNNLTCDDLNDIISLKSHVGCFNYTPQKDMDPMNCNINIPSYIPDTNFRKAIESYMGVPPDSIITAYEAAAKTSDFDCSNQNIQHATGIEFFSSIERFDCSRNQLKSLNIYNNPKLTHLSCSENQITSLAVRGATGLGLIYIDCNNNLLTNLNIRNAYELTHLNCSWNQLSSLNVSSVSDLITLDCHNNHLTKLNVSHNHTLENLYCGANQLITLDLSNNTSLVHLNCWGNQLTCLDLFHNPALESFDCYWNQLTSLDVSNNPGLEYLNCGWNQLTSLDVTNNTALENLYCYWNQITNLSSFVANEGLGPGDHIDVRYNYIGCKDINATQIDLQILTERIGNGFHYKPQREYPMGGSGSDNNIMNAFSFISLPYVQYDTYIQDWLLY